MRITYCMMCMNSLMEVAQRIKEMRPIVDRIVIIDGGSSDDTIQYLRNSEGVDFRLHKFEDHFSNQRNKYLQVAMHEGGGTDWIVVSDPDESFNDAFRNDLRSIVQRAEEAGKNMLQIRCNSRSWKGDKLTHESQDNYHKGLIFKAVHGICYTGNPHEFLNIPGGQKIWRMPEQYWYYHDKQENITWKRGMRNAVIGGGGPNMGNSSPVFRDFKKILERIGWKHEWKWIHDKLVEGDVPQELRDFFINKCRVQTRYDGACFTPEQYILTKTGAVMLDFIGKDEEVLSELGVTRTVMPMKKQYKGTVYELKGVNMFPIEVTGNHKIMVAEREECKDSKPYCRPDCKRSIPKYREDKRNPDWSGEYKNCSQEYKHELKWVESKDIIPQKHCFLYPKIGCNDKDWVGYINSKTKEGNEVGDVVRYKDEMCELLGWYLAEGCTYRNEIVLSLHLHDDPHEHIAYLIRKCFPSSSVKVYDNEDRTSRVLRFKESGNWTTEYYKSIFGDKSTNKHIPEFVFHFNKHEIECFLKGVIGGGGCVYSKGGKYDVVSYSTASKRLAMEMQFLFSKIGVFPGIDIQQREDRFSDSPIYRLTIEGNQVNKLSFLKEGIKGSNKQYFYEDDDFFYLPCSKIESRYYEGSVFNVETMSNVYVSGCIVHNSEWRECYKYYFKVLHPEQEPEHLKGEHIE